MSELLRTPLYELHRAAGARFVEFGGWEMPVQYQGLLKEHAAVREAAGLFDVSHMGEIEVEGSGALALCQRLTTNDASVLDVGRAQYTIWCDEEGGTIDDTILYRLGEDRFLFCVNASNLPSCRGWIEEHASDDDSVSVRDRSEATALFALQGPSASRVVRAAGASWLAELKRFGCGEGALLGRTILGARTGYTGEDGFEIFCRAAEAAELWSGLMAAGAVDGLVPVGLGARDTLRLEAGLALYGHELGPEISPLEAGLGWAVKLDKGDFFGAQALRRQHEEGPPRRLIGLGLRDKGIARADYPVLAGARPVGRITSGTRSPTLGRAIALALVTDQWVDADLSVEIRGRAVEAERLEVPFYKPPSRG